jgi:hypothetical protein
MKKILIGILVTTTITFTFQVITVQANFLFDITKLDKIIHNIEGMFATGEKEITELLWDQQEERLTEIEEYLIGIYEEKLSSTTADFDHYKDNYLSEVKEVTEEFSLKEPYEQFAEQKASELESELEMEIVDFIGQIVGKKSNHSYNLE